MKLMFLDAEDFNYAILTEWNEWNEWKWNRKDDSSLACSTCEINLLNFVYINVDKEHPKCFEFWNYLQDMIKIRKYIRVHETKVLLNTFIIT